MRLGQLRRGERHPWRTWELQGRVRGRWSVVLDKHVEEEQPIIANSFVPGALWST